MTMYELDPIESPEIELEEIGFTIASENLYATEITAYAPPSLGVRDEKEGIDFSQSDLEMADVREIGTVTLTDSYPKDEGKSIELSYVPEDPAEDHLLIYVDESGGMSFHVPEPSDESLRFDRADDAVTFKVGLRNPEPPAEDETEPVRGLGQVGEIMLKALGFKLAETGIQEYGPGYVRQVESKHLPMRIVKWPHIFEAEGQALGKDKKIPPNPDDRALLFIHGTFSRLAHAFTGIDDKAFLDELHAIYDDRIYGFDHPTVATGIATNIMQFYDRLEAGGVYNFDIICHSRGGLVARTLRDLNEDELRKQFEQDAKRGKYEDELKTWGQSWSMNGAKVNVERIMFAGTPNHGTILANPNEYKRYLEILLTGANLLPGGLGISIGLIVSVAKLLVQTLTPELPGLDDQKPGSQLIKGLQDMPASGDAVVQADYEPPRGLRLVMRLTDTVADSIHKDKNDILVTLASVSEWKSGSFDQKRIRTFPEGESVWHSTLFKQDITRASLLKWLR
jgi:hypothetical protein